MPIARQLLGHVHGPHESLVNPPPIGPIPQPLLDFGTEIEMSHGLLHHVEAVERHGEIEWRGIFDQFGAGGSDLFAVSRSRVLRFLLPLVRGIEAPIPDV